MDWLDTIGVNFDMVPHLVTLLVAYVLALPIGWDREKNERSAGLRTFPLVAIASCGFIQAAESIVHGNPEATARIVEGLITGMGFIGGRGYPGGQEQRARHGHCCQPLGDGCDRNGCRPRRVRHRRRPFPGYLPDLARDEPVQAR